MTNKKTFFKENIIFLNNFRFTFAENKHLCDALDLLANGVV